MKFHVQASPLLRRQGRACFHQAVSCVGGTACNLLENSQKAAGPLRSQDRLLNRMNSAFFRYLLSREKRELGIHRTVRIHAKPLLQSGHSPLKCCEWTAITVLHECEPFCE